MSVSNRGKIKLHRVDCVVDCGLAVNPDSVKNQMEGAIVMGASATLFEKITIKNGRVEESNFDDYRIARMKDIPFADLSSEEMDYYPEELRNEIDAINSKIYETLNNGVYRCGFATTQKAYEVAFSKLFVCLDELESRLSNQRFLLGSRITEADWRLFTTLIRFDSVYYSHFKTNLRRIFDYPEGKAI